LGERLLCKQEVIGSIPFTSTTDRTMHSIVRVERAAAVRSTARVRLAQARAGVLSCAVRRSKLRRDDRAKQCLLRASVLEADF
jgi:hypothetical protein